MNEPLPSPMLATAATRPPTDDDPAWAYEMKWDGYRAIVEVTSGRLRIVSRRGNDVTARYPELSAATEALRESIVREMNSNVNVHNMNVSHQTRYRRWGYGFGPFTYGQEIYKDTAIYYSDLETGEPRGNRRLNTPRLQPGVRPAMGGWPQVTFFSGGTEAPDETAQGEWLNLVAKAGFSYLMASVKYLQNGEYDLERIEEAAGQQDAVSLTMLRVRPVRPGRVPNPTRMTTNTGGGK